ncbi:MAG: Smr/MutS family protein [Bacteroidota bacterium]
MEKAQFKIGDQVAVLDEDLQGIVTAIEGNTVTLVTVEGFPMKYDHTDLVKIANDIQVSNYEAYQVKRDKEVPRKKKVTTRRPKARHEPKLEVDLHIQQLTTTTTGMTNFDMLNLQLDTAKRQLEFAIRKRIPKIVFIHGVGEGVLKEELYYLLKRYPVRFYDANYQKYGLGATEVYIFQNT